MKFARGAATVAVVLAVSGCATSPKAPVLHRAAAVDLGTLMLQPPELGAAEALLTQRCLHEHGFEVPRPRAVSGSAPNLPAPLDPRAGYGDALDRGHPDVLGEYAQRLPEAARARFARVVDDPSSPREVLVTPDGWQVSASTGGCVAQGRAGVYGSVRGWLTAVFMPQDLNAESGAAQSDHRVEAALTAYAGCMRRREHDVARPEDAVELARQHAVAGAPPSPSEVALAGDDAACRTEAELLPAYLTALGENAGDWLAANEDQVRDAARLVEESTVRARVIVGTGSGRSDGTSST